MKNQAVTDSMVEAGLDAFRDHSGCMPPMRIRAVIERAFAASRASQPVPVATEGWKLVPVEPTGEMTYIGQQMRYISVNSIGAIYREMISAAPAQPAADQTEVPDSVWEALQRMIEDGLLRGPASQEDARCVARHRDHVQFLKAQPPSQMAEPANEWREISTMNLTDDLVWLRKGNNVDGPRQPETDDYDRYIAWAPVESPSLADGITQPAAPIEQAAQGEPPKEELERAVRIAFESTNDSPNKAGFEYWFRKGYRFCFATVGPADGQGEPDKAEIEAAAKVIYEGWYTHLGYVPWQDGGNSLMQDEARKLALAAIQAEGKP